MIDLNGIRLRNRVLTSASMRGLIARLERYAPLPRPAKTTTAAASESAAPVLS